MADSDEHAWDGKTLIHPTDGSDYGCYVKHIPVDKYDSCFYARNGFEISKTRTDIYNKEHRSIAKDKGYLYLDKVRKVVEDRAQELNTKNRLKNPARDGTDRQYRKSYEPKDSKWKQKHRSKIQSSIYLLLLDKEAWHVGKTLNKTVNPWWGGAAVTAENPSDKGYENFKPRIDGGWNYNFPYKHNHHHIIPAGAFKQYVINHEEGELSPRKRGDVIINSKWNINNKKNMILLPNEIPCADIIGLPAHCPFETRNHAKYCNKVKEFLTKVRNKINKAKKKTVHKILNNISLDLHDISDDLLNQLQKLPGQNLVDSAEQLNPTETNQTKTQTTISGPF